MNSFFFVLAIALSCSTAFASSSIDFTQYSCEDLRGIVRRAGPSGANLNGQTIWSDMYGPNYGSCNPNIELLTIIWKVDETGQQCPLGNGCVMRLNPWDK